MDGLNVLRSSIHPRATEDIDEIVDFIKGLIDKGFAYESSGSVYFDVQKFDDYGKLSGNVYFEEYESLIANDVVFFDMTKSDQKYVYTDGNHLHKSSSRIVSKQISDLIKFKP